MTNAAKLRLELFKKQIEEENIKELQGLSNETLLKILDLAIIPNSIDSKAVRYGFLFHLIFLEREFEKKHFISQINLLTKLAYNLTKTEKVIIKFGILRGFESKNWRRELHRFIKIPLVEHSGRKIISSQKFREIFYFAYNLVKRGKKNEQFPRF
jgi:hypothetical protein